MIGVYFLTKFFKENKKKFLETNKEKLKNFDENVLNKLAEIDDKIIDLNIEIADLEGRVEYIKSDKYQSRCFCRPAEWYESLYTGDILVFSYKKPPYWAYYPGVGKWHHAAIIYDKKYLVEAPGEGFNSRKKLISDFIDNGKYSEIAIIKMGLQNYEGDSLKDYIDNYLLDKPYIIKETDSIFTKKQAFFTKEGKENMEKFYCSSLVWRAHYSSGKFIDLDGDDGNDGVLPRELLNGNNFGEIIYKKF